MARIGEEIHVTKADSHTKFRNWRWPIFFDIFDIFQFFHISNPKMLRISTFSKSILNTTQVSKQLLGRLQKVGGSQNSCQNNFMTHSRLPREDWKITNMWNSKFPHFVAMRESLRIFNYSVFLQNKPRDCKQTLFFII